MWFVHSTYLPWLPLPSPGHDGGFLLPHCWCIPRICKFLQALGHCKGSVLNKNRIVPSAFGRLVSPLLGGSWVICSSEPSAFPFLCSPQCCHPVTCVGVVDGCQSSGAGRGKSGTVPSTLAWIPALSGANHDFHLFVSFWHFCQMMLKSPLPSLGCEDLI